MHCTLCNHVFCWVCGFAETSVVHGVQNGGHVCQWLNSFTFGYETQRGLACRIFGTAMIILLFPLVVFLVIALHGMALVYQGCSEKVLCIYCNCIQNLRKKWLTIVIFILLLPIRVVIFVAVLSFSTAVATLIVGLLIIPHYLLICCSLLYFLYRWCI